MVQKQKAANLIATLLKHHNGARGGRSKARSGYPEGRSVSARDRPASGLPSWRLARDPNGKRRCGAHRGVHHEAQRHSVAAGVYARLAPTLPHRSRHFLGELPRGIASAVHLDHEPGGCRWCVATTRPSAEGVRAGVHAVAGKERQVHVVHLARALCDWHPWAQPCRKCAQCCARVDKAIVEANPVCDERQQLVHGALLGAAS